MPNRIIKESIRTSRTVNEMTDFQFRLWLYLITYVDDYGRGSADPELLKGFVFPRRKRVSEKDIEKTLAELAGKGCINLYRIDGESYFYFPNWGEHQRIQTKKSKFPEPPALNDNPQNSTVGHGESPPESNPNPNPTNILSGKPDFGVGEVVDYLNQKTGRSYKSATKDTQRHVNARINEGFSFADFKRVVDYMTDKWLKDSERSMYLRPSTLFSPKFDGYLQQALARRGAAADFDEEEIARQIEQAEAALRAN